MKRICWRKGTKYYHVLIESTLLRNVIAVRCGWGRHGNESGATKTILCDNMYEVQMVIDCIRKRRKLRGYELDGDE
jgi:hypothetical protein